VRVRIDPSTIFLFFLIGGAFILAFQLREILLGILTAIVIASGVEPFTLRLSHYQIPRILSVLLVYSVCLAVLVTVSVFVVPVFITELTSLVENVPSYLVPVFNGSEDLGFVENILATYSGDLANLSENILPTISRIFGGIFSLVLFITLSFYLAIQKDGVAQFLRLITPLKSTDYVVNVWRRSQLKIGLWMQGQLISGLIIGLMVYIGMSIMGVPYPLLLAVVAALFELVPIFGPFFASVPAILLAVTTKDNSLVWFFLTGGYYVLAQQIQSNFIYPLLVRRMVGISPVVVLVAISFGASIGGLLGIILSVPVAAVLLELLSDLRDDKKRHEEELKDLEAQIIS
jgi:predicted PurR-regulated permease PerM